MSVAPVSADVGGRFTPAGYHPKGGLLDVAALATNNVWVVGNRPRDHYRQFAASVSHWDGTTWHVQYLDRSRYSDLAGISALDRDDIWAVGSHEPQSVAQPLIEHWDGSSWTEFPTANPPKKGGLSAVDALAGDDVWAVGSAGNRALIEHWNGQKWVQLRNPVSGELYSVYGASVSDVWAVGARYDNGYWRPVVEHYDGQSWSQDKAFIDVEPTGTTSPSGVYASSPDDVWVAGYSQAPAGGGLRILLEHWDGTSWSLVPGPKGDQMLFAIDGTSANDIWAVGAHGLYYGLALHWDGTQWTRNYDGRGFPPMDAVSAHASTDVWALSNGDRYASVEHWNGTKWMYR
jgi:hypothetical protein